MLHYVHQLVANCVCLLFGSVEWIHQSFFTENKVDESCGSEPKHYIFFEGRKTKTSS